MSSTNSSTTTTTSSTPTPNSNSIEPDPIIILNSESNLYTNDLDIYSANQRPPSIEYLKTLLENKMGSEMFENMDLNYFTFCFVEKNRRNHFEQSIYRAHRNDDFVLRRFKLNNDRFNIVLSSDRANSLSRQLRYSVRNKEDEITPSHPNKVFQPSKLIKPNHLNREYHCYYYMYKTKRKSINNILFKNKSLNSSKKNGNRGSNNDRCNDDSQDYWKDTDDDNNGGGGGGGGSNKDGSYSAICA